MLYRGYSVTPNWSSTRWLSNGLRGQGAEHDHHRGDVVRECCNPDHCCYSVEGTFGSVNVKVVPSGDRLVNSTLPSMYRSPKSFML